MKTKKIDEFTLEITKEVPTPTPAPITTTYERSFIENQIIEIQKSKDEFDALRDAELKECMDILVSMDKMGITSKKIDKGLT